MLNALGGLVIRCIAEPLQDSSGIYAEWSGRCYMDADVTYEARVYAFVCSLYGIPATIGGLALVLPDYESIPGKIFGYGLGYPLLITGGLALLMDLLAIPVALSGSPDKGFEIMLLGF